MGGSFVAVAGACRLPSCGADCCVTEVLECCFPLFGPLELDSAGWEAVPPVRTWACKAIGEKIPTIRKMSKNEFAGNDRPMRITTLVGGPVDWGGSEQREPDALAPRSESREHGQER